MVQTKPYTTMSDSLIRMLLESELGSGGRKRNNDNLLKTDYHRKLKRLIDNKKLDELQNAFADPQPVQLGYEEIIRETSAWAELLRRAFYEPWFDGAKSLIKAVPSHILKESDIVV